MLKTLKTSKWLVALILLVVVGCNRPSEQINPHLSYNPDDGYLHSLTPPFPPLTRGESFEEWGREYTIGLSLAKELDLYRSITALKRALILVPQDYIARRAELHYFIALSYYLGGRYDEVIDTFENSELAHVDEQFPAYRDLLVLLYESFTKTSNPEKTEFVLDLLATTDPKLSERLRLSKLVASANLDHLRVAPPSTSATRNVKEFAEEYEAQKKSPALAGFLNALPGAGYLYVGQKQSAFTALMINALTTAGAVISYQSGNYPLAALLTSVEAGWYFGCIYGASQAAVSHNERIYEREAHVVMKQNRLYPVLMLNHAF